MMISDTKHFAESEVFSFQTFQSQTAFFIRVFHKVSPLFKIRTSNSSHNWLNKYNKICQNV